MSNAVPILFDFLTASQWYELPPSNPLGDKSGFGYYSIHERGYHGYNLATGSSNLITISRQTQHDKAAQFTTFQIFFKVSLKDFCLMKVIKLKRCNILSLFEPEIIL